ncbi:hypothetical protein GUJ93_ZPchr0006g42167 [Zizania palustris]|uniref:non-specific serine/threonine protein kinase n=1 Tax=Zizania palustris TaxID=103762 RepID=A0A8J5T8U3_ZIZPA|nr:hypothetical protein GUJ93_ZPchr0006g42167 [Zizania palustris]
MEDRYKMGMLLGEGSFAKVYLAVDNSTGEEVAIKVMEKEKLIKLGAAQQIKREIAVMQRLRHPNVVRLHEVMANKKRIYVVMEYVPGGPLYWQLRRQSRDNRAGLREADARRFFQQLISALAYCHARGVYHRDIKPENLLIDKNGDLKVADFGLSALADTARKEALFHTVCGTPLYGAPEVFTRRGYDGAKADVWACGVVLFVLTAGRKPFPDDNINNLYSLICRSEYHCPSTFSIELVRLLHRLLHPDPARRISIPQIMEMRWFKKGFKEISYYVDNNDRLHKLDGSDKLELDDSDDMFPPSPSTSEYSISVVRTLRGTGGMHTSASAPALTELNNVSFQPRMRRLKSLNAFDIITSSPSFDLSGLFEERGEKMRFVSDASVSVIISKLEEIAGMVSFMTRTKECQVSIEATKNGQIGALAISAKVFELTPELIMIEVCKKAGDIAEYRQFCDNELKPGLRCLVAEIRENNDAVECSA